MGPRPIVTQAGAVEDRVRQGVLTSGPIYNFVQAERRARPYVSGGATETVLRRQTVTTVEIHDMLETGFTAVYSSCDDFFRSSGRDQTGLLVFRDIVVALSSMASGALAVIDGNNMGGQGNENVIAGIALGSTAVLSGVDIYTQRFLFGAENVDAVRELTMRTLDEHRARVLGTPPVTYERVLIHLTDHQSKCTLRAIARQARDAIASGRVGGDSGQGSQRAQSEAARDAELAAELGRIFDGEPLTRAQTRALWWLLNAQPAATAAEIAGPIRQALVGLQGSRSPINAQGAAKANNEWPRNAVLTVLARLSVTTLRAFQQEVAETRAAAATSVLPVPIAPQLPSQPQQIDAIDRRQEVSVTPNLP